VNRLWPALLAALLSGGSSSAQYLLPQSAFDCGGAVQASANYRLGASVALPVQGAGASANVAGWWGFWFPDIGATPLLDVGADGIVAPVGTIDSGAMVLPEAMLSNHGDLSATFDAAFYITLDGAPVYGDTERVSGLGPGSSLPLTFREWPRPHAPGSYVARCTTMLGADAHPENDSTSDWFVVTSRPPSQAGWQPRESLPGTTKVKDGGAVGCDHASGLVYALRGNKTLDFYAYSPADSSWSPKAGVLPGPDSRGVGKGGALCAGGGWVYATKGNNTLEFYRYRTSDNTWLPAGSVPPGDGRKKVKGGTSLAFASRNDSGFVYLLKGIGTEFYRYDVAQDSFFELAPAPTGDRAKWDKGSWIVYDGSRYIYALKARYNELHRFDVWNEQWLEPTTLEEMPLNSSVTGRANKKAGDGGCAAWDGQRIHALKGNNTQQFWRYAPESDGDTWVELESIPQSCFLGERKRRVKAGAGIAWDPNSAVFYALKGNKCNQFWTYAPGNVQVPAQRLRRDGVTQESRIDEVRSTIFPNPTRAGVLLASIPSSITHHSTISIYDALGRRVSAPAVRGSAAGAWFDAGSLPAGAYLVRVSADGRAVTLKLVVGR
jgi:hypothetical protein